MKIAKRIIQGFGIIIGLVVSYLSIVTFFPGFEIPEQPLEQDTLLVKESDAKPSQIKKEVSFKVKGTSLSAWLYLPENLSSLDPGLVFRPIKKNGGRKTWKHCRHEYSGRL
ncbi:MAG: hypothetical protein GY850_09720 [bacterium]|nr:hypothetical protein [bacterium]